MNNYCSWFCIKTLVLITIKVLLFNVAESQSQCPPRCLCFQTTVRCMFLHLEKIPTENVPADTKVLDLRFNGIKEIPPFQFHNVTRLETLLLNNNQISELKNDAFQGLSSLKHLSLYKNRIRHIDPRTFSPLVNLEQLYLHYNYISSLTPSTLLSNQRKLTRLFLQNNRIVKIPAGVFDSLERLERLRLDGNALSCNDCGMMSFAKMLQSHKDTTVAAVCQEPLDMKGKSVKMMMEMEDHNEIQCRKPTIIEEPTDVEIKTGATAYLKCKTVGDPEPKIVWIQNSQEITAHLPPRYSIMDDGTLMIENMDMDDVGTYECVARNEAGEVKSRKAIASVRVHQEVVEERGESTLPPAFTSRFTISRPRLLEVPTDVEISFGKKFEIKCRATKGSRIEWFHNDRRVFPSWNGVEIIDSGLLIKNASKEHSGIFRCTASNHAGNISAIAQVKVLNPIIPPTWLLTPTDSRKIVGIGERFVLQCDANGVPEPIIRWLKNGEIIQGNERIRISKGHLDVTSALQSDHGEYSCWAENTGGSIETVTDVKIISGWEPTFTHERSISSTRISPGTPIHLPCSASGSPPPTIIWRKDGLALLPDPPRISFLPNGTLIIATFNPTLDVGSYKCSAFNDHGFISGEDILITTNGIAARNTDDDDDEKEAIDAFTMAKFEVETAENETLRILSSVRAKKVLSPLELLRLSRFPHGEQARFLARPAEIYERALMIIKEKVEKGDMKVNMSSSLKDFSYQDQISKSQIATLSRLSGCISHRKVLKGCNRHSCFKYRRIDGTCNNLNHTMWGGSYTTFQRLLPAQYENGFNTPKGWTPGKLYNGYPLPPARVVTNKLITTDHITPDLNYTHMLMQWGQFLDHDLDHALPSLSIEAFGEQISCRRTCENVSPCFPMQAPTGDPRIRTRKCMELTRSAGVCGSGVTSFMFDEIQQREQINQLTSFIDASQVYGSSEEELRSLRSQTEPIYLRNGIFMYPDKPMMPFATDDNWVDCRRNFRESDVGCFLGGDIRSNEQVGLLAMHTLFFRQHNFIAKQLRSLNPLWSDETVFQETRKILGAQMQHVTYNDWLPKIVGTLGMEEMKPYEGYDPKVNPTITNAFATAAMRFGHTLINPVLHRLDHNYQTIREGDLPLRQAFFAPWRLLEEGGVDPVIRGLFMTPAKLRKSNELLNSHLTNELFTHAHLVALDLASMNIQRSRDHGLPGYNEYREMCGLRRAKEFEDLRDEIPYPDLLGKLRQVYGHVDNIDLWVGGVMEVPTTEDSRVGPTFRCILVDQFRRLRDGDRFWYENPDIFTPEQTQEIKRTTLARLLCDTGDSLTQVKADVFSMPSELVGCKLVKGMRLERWKRREECCGLSENNNDGQCSSRSTVSSNYTIISNSSTSRILDGVRRRRRNQRRTG